MLKKLDYQLHKHTGKENHCFQVLSDIFHEKKFLTDSLVVLYNG